MNLPRRSKQKRAENESYAILIYTLRNVEMFRNMTGKRLRHQGGWRITKETQLRSSQSPRSAKPTGLAMSSRNRYLIQEERRRAGAIRAGLFTARTEFQAGERDGKELLVIAAQYLETVVRLAISRAFRRRYARAS